MTNKGTRTRAKPTQSIPPRIIHAVDIEKYDRDLAEARAQYVAEAEKVDKLRNTLAILEHGYKQEQQKVTKLKAAARFFRAQRDRVDAYLSGVLDNTREARAAMLRQSTVPETELRHIGAALNTLSERTAQQERTMRPSIQEPFMSANPVSDDHGRIWTSYRDQEPTNWEDL